VPTVAAAWASPAAAGATIPLLRIGSLFSISNLNPANPGWNNWLGQLYLETLVNLGPNDKLEPSLATSWAQTSPTTYIYHIRHGVRFWDGDQLTAADVAFSLNYYRRPASYLYFAFSGEKVKNIVATGPYTVEVTLSQPNAAWQYVPAQYVGIVEQKFYEEHKATYCDPGTLVMGTGPWEIDTFDPTSGAQLSANPNWWGGTVPVQHISFKLFSSETNLELAMRAGEIDVDPYVLDTKLFASTSQATVEDSATATTAVFAMNTQEPPWNDAAVRRAVAYALNRTDIVAAAGGYNPPIYTFFPPVLLRELAPATQVNALLSSVPLYPYDPAKAKEELA
jgi:peptide/nickel transport system substrate-binding protein